MVELVLEFRFLRWEWCATVQQALHGYNASESDWHILTSIGHNEEWKSKILGGGQLEIFVPPDFALNTFIHAAFQLVQPVSAQYAVLVQPLIAGDWKWVQPVPVPKGEFGRDTVDLQLTMMIENGAHEDSYFDMDWEKDGWLFPCFRSDMARGGNNRSCGRYFLSSQPDSTHIQAAVVFFTNDKFLFPFKYHKKKKIPTS